MRKYTAKQYKIISWFLIIFGTIGMITRRISGSKGSNPTTEGNAAILLGAFLVVAGLVIYYVKVLRVERE